MKTPKPLTPEEKAAMSESAKRLGIILNEKPKKKGPTVLVRQVPRDSSGEATQPDSRE